MDVTFLEDASRIRQDNSSQNMVVLRHIALNILKNDKSKSSLKQKRFKAALDDTFLLKLIDQLWSDCPGLIPIKLDIFEKLQDIRDEELRQTITSELKDRPKRDPKPKRRKTIDLMAIPDDVEESPDNIRPLVSESSDDIPKQLAMF